jgi:predicted RNase H-like HicB family nuclease
VETLVGSYSATVGGTQYAGSVEEQNGSYVASVPSVSGATATGSSIIDAENNLTVRIDELV